MRSDATNHTVGTNDKSALGRAILRGRKEVVKQLLRPLTVGLLDENLAPVGAHHHRQAVVRGNLERMDCGRDPVLF